MQLERIPWSETFPPTRSALRCQLEADGFNVFLWIDEPGATYGTHAHDHDECIWALAGEIVFEIAGRSYPLGPGDRLMLPRLTRHSAHVGPQGATYLVGQK